MANREILDQQREETRLIIKELREDHSDLEAVYTIEHHFSAEKLEVLQQVLAEARKLGYELGNIEPLDIEDDPELMCCDVIGEARLKEELINAQVEQLVELANKYDINYDGWGTYYVDPPEGEEGNKVDAEDPLYAGDDGKRH